MIISSVFMMTSWCSTEFDEVLDRRFYKIIRQKKIILRNIVTFLEVSERMKFLYRIVFCFQKNDVRLSCLKQFQDNKLDEKKNYYFKTITNISPWIRFFLFDSVNLQLNEDPTLIALFEKKNTFENEEIFFNETLISDVRTIEIIQSENIFDEIRFVLTSNHVLKLFNTNDEKIGMYKRDHTHASDYIPEKIFEIPHIKFLLGEGYQNGSNIENNTHNYSFFVFLGREGITTVTISGNDNNPDTMADIFKFPGIENKNFIKFHVSPKFIELNLPDVTLFTTECELMILKYGNGTDDIRFCSLGTHFFGKKFVDIQFILEENRSISPHVRIILEDGEKVVLRKDSFRLHDAKEVKEDHDSFGIIRVIRKEFPNEFPFASNHEDN